MSNNQNSNDVFITRFSLQDLENVTTCINIAYSETMAIFKNVHIRRTSKEQLEEVMNKEKAELWGFKTKTGEVVAVVMIRDIDETSGTVDMLSVMPEYMGLGLSSALLNHSEYILHKANKKLMKMKVFIPSNIDLKEYENLGYKILKVEPWIELKESLKPAAFESWSMLTVGKEL